MDEDQLLAVILSVIIPGLGQLVNGDTAKGLVFLLGSIASWVAAPFLIATFILAPVGLLLPVALWIGGIVDAAKD